jgi:hypothetical protein
MHVTDDRWMPAPGWRDAIHRMTFHGAGPIEGVVFRRWRHRTPISVNTIQAREADADPVTNVVDVYVARRRKKIDRPGAPRISTIRGVGYRMECPTG